MEFQIERNRPVPVIKQIQEQIKLSIAMGVLKRGDVLPPIREVEKQMGINRGQIHRTYLAWGHSGLLSPAPGKRTAVAVSAAAPDIINKKCQELSKDIIKRIRRIGVSPIAFSRYLSQSTQEDEHRSPFIAYVDPDKEIALRRSEQVSRLWHASVIGLSVDGFKLALAQDNTVTVFFPNTFVQTVPGGTNAQGILDTLTGMTGSTMSSIILIPSWAKVLSSEGWTKKKVKEYLAAHGTPNSSSVIPSNAASPPKIDIDKGLMILVAGGPGSFIALLRSAGPGFFENSLVTKKIELPKNWDKLVAKYKNLKPNYEMY